MEPQLILICLTFLYGKGMTNETNPKEESRIFLPYWLDLNSRRLPKWYSSAKIGIFIHWGIYSVPSIAGRKLGSEWFWHSWKSGEPNIAEFMTKHYPKEFKYENFAPMLTGEFYEPDEWAELFYKSGAKYVVFTTKHHDGYSLFPSRTSKGFNSLETGPKIDVTQSLAEAVRKLGLKFGTYYSLYEWFDEKFMADRKAESQVYVAEKVIPDIKQLVNDYKPSVLWADGEWDGDDKYWNSTEILAWLYSYSPVKDEVVVNDRWGFNNFAHGDFYSCYNKYTPYGSLDHAWENAVSLDLHSWGFRRNMEINEFVRIDELLQQLMYTVSLGGNVLINVGPTAEGVITPIFQERLLQLGQWLKINGEAVYNTSPCSHQYDGYGDTVFYTCRKKETYDRVEPYITPCTYLSISALYITFLKWPINNILATTIFRHYLQEGIQSIELLGSDGHKNLRWMFTHSKDSDSIMEQLALIYLPKLSNVTVQYGWTLKITRKDIF